MNASLKQPLTQIVEETDDKAPLAQETLVIPKWLKNTCVTVILLLILLYAVDRLYHPGLFQIREVSVHGELKNVNSAQIVDALQVGITGNFFSVDLTELSQYVETLPWVYDASMRLTWPATLHVTIDEIKPIARWGEQFWMHETGEIVERVENADDVNLPQLQGPSLMSKTVWKNYADWQQQFSKYGIELKRLTFDERELWHMHLSADYLADVDAALGLVNAQQKITHEVDFVIPNENANERVEKFIAAMQPQLLSQFLLMKKVDLRYPNGFAIAWDETRKVQQQIDSEVEGDDSQSQ